MGGLLGGVLGGMLGELVSGEAPIPNIANTTNVRIMRKCNEANVCESRMLGIYVIQIWCQLCDNYYS
jgi:hypothetical protein